jgi:pteridine reductase
VKGYSKTRGTALVTGGAKRIGRAICLHLARRGYRIALHYHTSERPARLLARKIERQGGACRLFPCDLEDEKAVEALVPGVARIFPDLRLLVNNASVFERGSMTSGDTSLFNRNFAVNLKAPFILSRYFALRGSRRAQGQIINMADTHVVQNKVSHFSYLLSKKALCDLTKLAAAELAPRIRVNAIAPGPILPPSGEKDAYLKRLAGHIPLKRKGEMIEILRAMDFLLDHAYVTGQILFVDGGEHLI